MAFSCSIGRTLAVKENIAMPGPILKLVFPSCVAVSLGLCSLQAQTQKNIVTIDSVSPVRGLHANPPIALPTTHPGSREALSKKAPSPFARSASSNLASSNRESNGADEDDGLRFPGDLQYHGGPYVDYAQNHSVFLNPTSACPPNSCFGDPIGFLDDLGRSQFIHVTDQYVGTHASHRYTNGKNYAIHSYTPSAGAGKPFTDEDMYILAYNLAAQTGGFGFNHIYHLFLKPGQDICFDNTFSVCYPPDNNDTWIFCAYHGAVYDDAGNIALYSVEPYQNVPGCSVRPDGPNGQLTDSTNNVLSHEEIETITDPFGTAWWNLLDLGLRGEEIADECSFLLYTPNDVFFDPSVVRLNHKQYALQPEYSNSQHACSTNVD
jgi:hypothetical protein